MGEIKYDSNQYSYVKDLLNQAADAEQRNTEEALRLANEALNLSIEHQFSNLEANAFLRIGRCHWINGNYDFAINDLTKALDICNEIEDDYIKTDVLIGLGNVYVTIGIMDQAISLYNNGLKIASKNNYGELESKILNNIGTMHEDLKNYDSALDYYQRSLDKAKELDDGYGMSIAYINIANAYLSLKKFDLSSENIVQAIEYGENHDKTLLLAHCYYTLGRLKQETLDLEESLSVLKQAIIKAKDAKDLYILFRIYIELSLTYNLKNDIEEAESYLIKAKDLAEEIDMAELMPKIYEQLAIFYEKQQRKEEAFECYKRYLESSKVVEESRRLERINGIEYQSKLSASLEETKQYRQLSNELQSAYQKMHVLSNIGQSMTSTHHLKTIFKQLYDNVNELMIADGLAVGLYDEIEKKLKFDFYIENGLTQDSFSLTLDNQNSWNVWSFNNRKAVKINDVEKEYQKYISGFHSSRGELMHSAMYAPLIVEGDIIGVFSIQAKQKNAYSDIHQDLIKTLASYLAIAIRNANKTKELAILNEKFKQLSESDGLTGIPNRRMFNDIFDKTWKTAIETKQSLVLMMIDIDDFKEFNDQYGHLTGDEVIKQVASLLNSNECNHEHFVARYGGDEFIMLLPNHSLEEAEAYAKSIEEGLSTLSYTLNVKRRVTASIGISHTMPNAKKSKERLIAMADNQLYICKDKGKNTYASVKY